MSEPELIGMQIQDEWVMSEADADLVDKLLSLGPIGPFKPYTELRYNQPKSCLTASAYWSGEPDYEEVVSDEIILRRSIADGKIVGVKLIIPM